MPNLEILSEKYSIGIETLKDILKELQTPGHDPRDDLDPPKFSSNVMDIKELKIGDMIDGVVRNITDFGAFVDIGLHNDGLVHKSQLADRFVTHPMDVVSLGQQVRVKVVDIDLEREKVSLSMKTSADRRDVPLGRPVAEIPKPSLVKKQEDHIKTSSEIKGNIVRG